MTFMPTDLYKAGQTIFEEGYPADGVYFICSGKVQIVKRRGDTLIPLASLGEGNIFGEMAFIEERPRSATVIAEVDTWCYKHNKDVFQQRLKELDPIVSKLFHDLADVIREKSKAAVLIDHGRVQPLDPNAIEQLLIVPDRPKLDLLNDSKIQKKVDEMDLFMRTLYTSLVNIAYM